MDALSITHFKSGIWEQQYGYRSFLPELVHKSWVVDHSEVIELLVEAAAQVNQLNALGNLIAESAYMMPLYAAKEATHSSSIEGTKTSISEALLPVEMVEAEQRDDWQEVQNYLHAMHFALDELNRLPVCTRLLCKTHEVLLQGVRGKQKLPGEFRKSQNWIGGATLKDAVFIPPHHERIHALMSDLESMLNDQNLLTNKLIRIGIAHYQFGTIHPFLDGNGRLGRLLITLYLVSEGVLERPTLYMSDFFNRHRRLYYDHLTAVREKNDMVAWLKFFLVGVAESASHAIATFNKINLLRKKDEALLVEQAGRRKQVALTVLSAFFKQPTMNIKQITEAVQMNQATVFRIVEQCVALGILKEITGQKRNRVFRYAEYLACFEE